MIINRPGKAKRIFGSSKVENVSSETHHASRRDYGYFPSPNPKAACLIITPFIAETIVIQLRACN